MCRILGGPFRLAQGYKAPCSASRRGRVLLVIADARQAVPAPSALAQPSSRMPLFSRVRCVNGRKVAELAG